MRPLDYDFGQQSYNLTVLASDGKLSGRAYVQVNVIDENDEAPKFDMDLYVAEAVENSPIGTVIIKVRSEDVKIAGIFFGIFFRKRCLKYLSRSWKNE